MTLPPPVGHNVGGEAPGAGPPGLADVLQHLLVLAAGQQALVTCMSDMENNQRPQQAQLHPPPQVVCQPAGGVLPGGQLLLGSPEVVGERPPPALHGTSQLAAVNAAAKVKIAMQAVDLFVEVSRRCFLARGRFHVRGEMSNSQLRLIF